MKPDTRGVYRKYTVRRTDGRDALGAKHDGCHLFILDLDHDPAAKGALLEYCRGHAETGDRPQLVQELREFLAGHSDPWEALDDD